MSRISEAWVYENRLVVIADAGNVSTVGILEIGSKVPPFWFVCYEPARVFNRWVVYTEFWPGHVMEYFSDVLLAYDLRARRASNLLPDSDIHADEPVNVGIPIYPPDNARQRSYWNIAESESDEIHMLASPIGRLSAKRIAFVAEFGSSAADYVEKVVVVSIPSDPCQVAKSAESVLAVNDKSLTPGKCCLHVTGISETSSGKIRLTVPPREYGGTAFFDTPIPTSGDDTAPEKNR